jgi:hypothetical protein
MDWTQKCDGLTGGRKDGRSYEWAFIGYFFCLKVPNKTTKVPNNTDGMNRITQQVSIRVFKVPNKCPFVRPDGLTDGQVQRYMLPHCGGITKGHNSVKFGCSKNTFLYCHLHIKVVNPWKFKQNLPSGLRGVAFTKFLHSI